MHRQTNGRPQSGYRSYGKQADGNSSDGRVSSSSSGGSNNTGGFKRPIILPPASPVSRVETPEQLSARPSNAEAPTALGTRTHERTLFSLNGQQINETYRPRSRVTPSPPKFSTLASSAVQTSSPRQQVHTQNAFQRPMARESRGHWALQQELKVKILGIDKCYWTKDVYFAMSTYGSVIRVDIETGSRDNNAWVVFQ